MEPLNGRIAELLSAYEGNENNDLSRATSPGGEPHGFDLSQEPLKKYRYRERTYPYFQQLPYSIEGQETRERNLDEIIERLYISIEAGDFSKDVVHWTREIRGWLSLKFDMTREQRSKLAKVYYELALAPGIDVSSAERFANMFMLLAKHKHYLRPFKDLVLDWRPLYKEIKAFVLPQASGMYQTPTIKRSSRTLCKLAIFAQFFFDPKEIPAMLEEFLPYFTTSWAEGAFVVVGLINLFLPTSPPPPDQPQLQPQAYLPTLFHLWSLMNRSRVFDTDFVDYLSHLARDSIAANGVTFSEFGIFTSEQSAVMFTAILRLLEIPVGQSGSSYSAVVDLGAGLAVVLDRDPKKHPVAHHIARWIVLSLSPKCLEKEDSMLSRLEGLIQAVETFFHPSNYGQWTRTLSQLVFYLADFFVMRWNRERNGEINIPEDRKLNEAVRRRFVLCLRDVIFMGIYAKSGTAMSFSLATLQDLAWLEPNLILPGALQRIYPSMQGLVEVHRTTSSLRSLQVLSRTISRTRGFRCHITTLLGLALPGIDANDLEKSLYTLSFIQSVCYSVPFDDLTKGAEIGGSMIAMNWITSEVERMEQEGANVVLNYGEELTDEDEAAILRSSTSGFGEFLTSFLGRVFTLLENLPDASRFRSGTPEEQIVNTIAATLLPLFAALSTELYDMALNKIADFITNHVLHQARDAMAFICNGLCKVHPKRALKKLVPLLIQGIRTEIDENGAASTRHISSDVLPRDRGLVWNISMLSMCVVHVGQAVLDHKKELFDIAVYMQEKCKGIPTIHISNYIHHLLLNLTVTYTVDFWLYEKDVFDRGIVIDDWGKTTHPKDINVKWHVPNHAELTFAVELFVHQAESAIKHLTSLINGTSSVKRDGIDKGWSDELARNLVLIRLLLAGVSVLFDNKAIRKNSEKKAKAKVSEADGHVAEMNGGDSSPGDKDEDSLPRSTREYANNDEDDEEVEEEMKIHFDYPSGYPLKQDDPLYQRVHETREKIGYLLHEVHVCLITQDEDEVTCFSPLYLAYRSWFTDVGIERSAHVLERVTRLLSADIAPFKIAGMRKDYPRPLLARRAYVYHMQRLKYNACPRRPSELEKQLMLDLVQSSLSQYTEVRRIAQQTGEASLKVLIGARLLVIPPLIKGLEEAISTNDFPKIKGAIWSLLYGSLHKGLGRMWKHTPVFIRAYITASTVDRPSVQKLCLDSRFALIEWFRPADKLAILDETIINEIAPARDVSESISKKKKLICKKNEFAESSKAKLSEELLGIVKDYHWRTASMVASFCVNSGLRFETLASPNMIKLVVEGVNDAHPNLRKLYAPCLVGILTMTRLRVLCKHSTENFLLDKLHDPFKTTVPTERDDPEWTSRYLASFAQVETDYYVDQDHPGWLVWDKSMPAFIANPKVGLEYDEVEKATRANVGKYIDREWFNIYFKLLKQEPRDAPSDRFRMPVALLLYYVFDLVINGVAVATFDELKEEIKVAFGNGTDKHEHRATAEILAGLLGAIDETSIEKKRTIWEFAFPLLRHVITDGLTPETIGYWTSFLHYVLQTRDPRRAWPLIDFLSEFRLDMLSNAAFKESSKILLLHQCIAEAGWHFQREKPIVKDFLSHIDHPYKGVREAMGAALGSIFRSRYHESYSDVETLMRSQRECSSIGTPPYQPSEEFSEIIRDIFRRLEKWRLERVSGQQFPSSYTSGSKTVLVMLDGILSSQECTQLTKFFPDLFTEELLHMMDVKEDPELQNLAYHVFRHLPNIPHRNGEDRELISTICRIGTTSSSWHQRLRIMINIQIIYFRRLFLITLPDREKLFACVAGMLQDPQHEVRNGAATTLSGMIRCSPVSLRNRLIAQYKDNFTAMLRENPLPKRSHLNHMSAPTSRVGTPTPEQTRITLLRHGAVLGLGALIQAFPYTSPPPSWMPDVLITLSTKAAGDPGIVGQSVKSIISEFKKTRQDTWHIDVKAFTSDQVEDLNGVLWKSYFA